MRWSGRRALTSVTPAQKPKLKDSEKIEARNLGDKKTYPQDVVAEF